MEHNGFTNVIKKPTRLDPSSGKETLIDVILCSSPASCILSNVFSYSRSDHRLIISIFNFKSSKYKFCSIPSRCLNETKMELLKTELKLYFSKAQFKDLTGDADTRWKTIKNGIRLCLDKIAPINQINVRVTKSLPWYDRQLVNLGHKRNALYNKWNLSKCIVDRETPLETFSWLQYISNEIINCEVTNRFITADDENSILFIINCVLRN